MWRYVLFIADVVKILAFISFAGMLWTYIGLIVLTVVAIVLGAMLHPSGSGPATHDQYWEDHAR